jgi:hypothetical protein
MMVRWVVTTDSDLVTELYDIPFHQRESHPKLVNLLQVLKEKWKSGTKIEKLAVLGWNDAEARKLFSDIIQNLPFLKEEYNKELLIHGKVTELADENLKDFEKAVKEERKNRN